MAKRKFGPRSRRADPPAPDGSIAAEHLGLAGVTALTRKTHRVIHNQSTVLVDYVEALYDPADALLPPEIGPGARTLRTVKHKLKSRRRWGRPQELTLYGPLFEVPGAAGAKTHVAPLPAAFDPQTGLDEELVAELIADLPHFGIDALARRSFVSDEKIKEIAAVHAAAQAGAMARDGFAPLCLAIDTVFLAKKIGDKRKALHVTAADPVHGLYCSLALIPLPASEPDPDKKEAAAKKRASAKKPGRAKKGASAKKPGEAKKGAPARKQAPAKKRAPGKKQAPGKKPTPEEERALVIRRLTEILTALPDPEALLATATDDGPERAMVADALAFAQAERPALKPTPVFDPFHVIMNFVKVLRRRRVALYKKWKNDKSKKRREARPLLKSLAKTIEKTRWSRIERDDDTKAKMHYLFELAPDLEEAYFIVDGLRRVFDCRSPEMADRAYAAWRRELALAKRKGFAGPADHLQWEKVRKIFAVFERSDALHEHLASFGTNPVESLNKRVKEVWASARNSRLGLIELRLIAGQGYTAKALAVSEPTLVRRARKNSEKHPRQHRAERKKKQRLGNDAVAA